LEAKFSDEGFSSNESDLSEPIENLRNLGSTSAAWLREVGITTIAELECLGPALAYRLVREKQPRASLYLLWALAAGLLDRDWRELTDQAKDNLRAKVEQE
jgi:DNA transformation protein and related proteins